MGIKKEDERGIQKDGYIYIFGIWDPIEKNSLMGRTSQTILHIKSWVFNWSFDSIIASIQLRKRGQSLRIWGFGREGVPI